MRVSTHSSTPAPPPQPLVRKRSEDLERIEESLRNLTKKLWLFELRDGLVPWVDTPDEDLIAMENARYHLRQAQSDLEKASVILREIERDQALYEQEQLAAASGSVLVMDASKRVQ